MNPGCYSGWVEEEGAGTDQVKLILRSDAIWISLKSTTSSTTIYMICNISYIIYLSPPYIYLFNHQAACSIFEGWSRSKIQLQWNHLSSKEYKSFKEYNQKNLIPSKLFFKEYNRKNLTLSQMFINEYHRTNLIHLGMATWSEKLNHGYTAVLC